MVKHGDTLRRLELHIYRVLYVISRSVIGKVRLQDKGSFQYLERRNSRNLAKKRRKRRRNDLYILTEQKLQNSPAWARTTNLQIIVYNSLTYYRLVYLITAEETQVGTYALPIAPRRMLSDLIG